MDDGGKRHKKATRDNTAQAILNLYCASCVLRLAALSRLVSSLLVADVESVSPAAAGESARVCESEIGRAHV